MSGLRLVKSAPRRPEVPGKWEPAPLPVRGDRRGYAAEYHAEIARGETWWEDGVGWTGRARAEAAE